MFAEGTGRDWVPWTEDSSIPVRPATLAKVGLTAHERELSENPPDSRITTWGQDRRATAPRSELRRLERRKGLERVQLVSRSPIPRTEGGWIGHPFPKPLFRAVVVMVSSSGLPLYFPIVAVVKDGAFVDFQADQVVHVLQPVGP